jgi:PAS domain S-box-containing protein
MNNIRASDPPSGRVLERWSIYLVCCLMAIALATLAGWQWDIDLLRRPSPALVAMNPTTALGLLLASLSFLCFVTGRQNPKRRKLGNIFAWIVLAVGFLSLAGFLTPDMIHFDHFLYAKDLQLDSTIHGQPNRLAITTGLCFLLAGYSLVKLYAHPSARTGKWSPVEVAAAIMGFVAFISLVGFLYRVREFYGSLQYLRMAVYTSVCFPLLAVALIIASPQGNIMSTLTGSLTGSLTARRLLPFAFLFPLLLGELRLIGHWQGHLSTEMGVMWLVLSIIICFVFVIWGNILLLNNRDAQRRRAEADLAAMESRWTLIVNSVKDYAIFLVDPEGKILTWNEGAQRIKGYSSQEIVGHHISAFYTDEEIERGEPMDNLRIAAATGRHYGEGWRVRKNGEQFWAEIVFTAIYDEQHRLLAFAKITRDMTIQKLAQEKIAYQARLMEDTSDAMVSTDDAFRIVSWNKAAQNLYGFSAKEAIGVVFGDLLRNPAEERIRLAPRRELREKGYWSGEVDLLTKNDQALVIALSISATRDEKHVHNGYIIACRDITERVRAETRLREFNELLEREVNEKTTELRDIFERVTDAFMAYDKDGNVVYANLRAIEMNAGRGFDLLGKNIWKEVPVAVDSPFGEHFRRAMELQQEQHFEMYSTALDLWLESHMYPSPRGISQFYRDITAHHNAEQQLKTSNEELRALASHLTEIREEERASMAREVHDELGQQLTGLKMDLALISKRASGESKEWLKGKMGETLALLDTTIRTVRKIASELRPSILDDLGLVAALDWHAQEFGKRMGIPTSFETNGVDIDIPPAVSIGLFRICQESLTNVARHARATHVRICLLEEEDHVLLSIQDDGQGIDPQKINKKEKTLGLLGMKERALMMGGTLTIDSAVRAGVTLSIKVPIEPVTKPK